jgi:hypothetical protein
LINESQANQNQGAFLGGDQSFVTSKSGGISNINQNPDYVESVKEVWKNCESILESLSQEKQVRIEAILEEVSQLKYEKISEIRIKYDLIFKRLKLSGLPMKFEQK